MDDEEQLVIEISVNNDDNVEITNSLKSTPAIESRTSGQNPSDAVKNLWHSITCKIFVQEDNIYNELSIIYLSKILKFNVLGSSFKTIAIASTDDVTADEHVDFDDFNTLTETAANKNSVNVFQITADDFLNTISKEHFVQDQDSKYVKCTNSGQDRTCFLSAGLNNDIANKQISEIVGTFSKNINTDVSSWKLSFTEPNSNELLTLEFSDPNHNTLNACGTPIEDLGDIVNSRAFKLQLTVLDSHKAKLTINDNKEATVFKCENKIGSLRDIDKMTMTVGPQSNGELRALAVKTEEHAYSECDNDGKNECTAEYENKFCSFVLSEPKCFCQSPQKVCRGQRTALRGVHPRLKTMEMNALLKADTLKKTFKALILI